MRGGKDGLADSPSRHTGPFSLSRAAPSTCEVAAEGHSSPSHALLIGGPGRLWTLRRGRLTSRCGESVPADGKDGT